MKNTCSLIFAVAFGLMLTANAQGQHENGAQSFATWMKAAGGSTWVCQKEDGQEEHTHLHLVGDKFGAVHAKGGAAPFVATMGVDPKNNQFTWWAFYEDGSVGTTIWESTGKNKWELTGSSQGPEGKSNYEGQVTVVDQDTIKEQINSSTLNGEEQPSVTSLWKRRNGARNTLLTGPRDDSWKDSEWKKLTGVWKAPEGEGHRIKRISEGQEVFELYDKEGDLTLKRSLKMELENHNGINFFRVSDPVVIFPEPAEGQEINSFSMLFPYKVHNGRWHEHTGLFAGWDSAPERAIVYERVEKE